MTDSDNIFAYQIYIFKLLTYSVGLLLSAMALLLLSATSVDTDHPMHVQAS